MKIAELSLRLKVRYRFPLTIGFFLRAFLDPAFGQFFFFGSFF